MTSSSMSEKEKSLAGELYQAFDPELVQERANAKLLCWKFNRTSPLEIEERKALLQEMVGVDDALIEPPFHLDYGYNMKIGKNFYANHGCTFLDCNVITIGNNVMLAPHVILTAATHPLSVVERRNGDELTGPITIGNDVWIGANATVLPNVTIGNNVVIGAGAVVNRDIPDNVVYGGVPAKIIRSLKGDARDDERPPLGEPRAT
jgi:maltose O-acetyltransferase